MNRRGFLGLLGALPVVGAMVRELKADKVPMVVGGCEPTFSRLSSPSTPCLPTIFIDYFCIMKSDTDPICGSIKARVGDGRWVKESGPLPLYLSNGVSVTVCNPDINYSRIMDDFTVYDQLGMVVPGPIQISVGCDLPDVVIGYDPNRIFGVDYWLMPAKS